MVTQPQSQTPQPSDPRPKPNGQRVDEATAQSSEQTWNPGVAISETMPDILRRSQDGAVRLLQVWTGAIEALDPFALLASRDGDQGLPIKGMVDGAFEMVEKGLRHVRGPREGAPEPPIQRSMIL
jgi:hypothetical protein